MTRRRAGIVAGAVAGGSLARLMVGSPPWALTLVGACVVGIALSWMTVAEVEVTDLPDAAEWWVSTEPAPRPETPATQPARPRRAKPLESYLKNAPPGRIPQCPGCAGFDIEAPRRGAQWFDCRACGHQWQWTAGDPWPPVTVQPFSPTSIHH